MSRHDAIIFRVDLGAEEAKSSAPVRARAERALDRARGEKSVWSRLQTVRRFRQIKRTLSSVRSARAAFGRARAGLAAEAEGLAARAGSRVVGTPVGAIAAALIVAGVAALRLASGKPLEGTGEAVNRMLLGDMDDEARARMHVGERFGSDADLSRIAAQTGGLANPQINALASDLVKLEKQKELGASLFREQFASNNMVDMLILRARDAAIEGWHTAGGEDKLATFEQRYQNLYGGAKGR